MQSIEPISSADPLKVIRSLPLIDIPINKITTRDVIQTDPIFESRYRAFLSGRTNVHYTRMPLSQIRRGFWRAHDGGFILIEEEVERRGIEELKALISFGNRPALFIYENPNSDDSFSYVCTDDLPVHAAYEDLGISVVPAVLMGKPRKLEETAVAIRSICRGPEGPIHLIEGVTPVEQSSFHDLLQSSDLSVSESLARLASEIELTKIDIRTFHKQGKEAYHYHHSLYSVLVRAKEQIDSIRLLIDDGKLLVATSLLRPLHELALTFYIDWLMPTHMYQYLQIASIMSLNEWETACEKDKKKHISEGMSKSDANRIKCAHIMAFRLCSIVAEKVRFFPFGEEYHRSIYSFLSDMVHHDFSMTARYIDALDHGDDVVFNGNVAHTIRHVAHATVSAILSRIRADIGAEKQPMTA
ncbi:DUF5677 domain-containing protein [Cupriavidus nantongensis]|uniref:DUF5677 domain-containing protein n=1 Tax=Cupriavidus nantongensis TaxID=1796606 RepID=UPI002246B4CD|nr:hypothetical protein [Cupriavidus nantongensis]